MRHYIKMFEVLKFGCSQLLHGKVYKSHLSKKVSTYLCNTLETFHEKNESPTAKKEKFAFITRWHYITVHKKGLGAYLFLMDSRLHWYIKLEIKFFMNFRGLFE